MLKSKLKMAAANINISDFQKITEGKASILFPKKEDVFYNHIQQFNRDLSILAIKSWNELYNKEVTLKNKKRKNEEVDTNEEADTTSESQHASSVDKVQENQRIVTFKPKFSILEALSATGLRAIRYAKEIPNIKDIVANDLLPAAVENINRNIQYNEVQQIVKSNLGDATKFMYCDTNYKFQVIDLDPYGTAAPFIDSAIQKLENNGLLMVTCTDLSVLAGNGYPEKCYALYGGTNLKQSEAVHESALRLVLNMIATTASKYKKSIEPLLSLSIDYYVRLFIKVKVSPIEVKKLFANSMISYVCLGCGSVYNNPLGRITPNEKNPTQMKHGYAQGPVISQYCQFCNNVNHIAGPMWGGKLHNSEFIDKILELNSSADKEIYKTTQRIEGMLTLAKQELDIPFYFSPSRISSILKMQCPSIKTIVSAIGNLGYEASLTHAAHGCIKTNAPVYDIWCIFKQYVEKNNLVNLEKMNKNLNGYKILTNEHIKLIRDGREVEVNFEENQVSEQIGKLRNLKIVRYQMNPTKNWGPKAKPQ